MSTKRETPRECRNFIFYRIRSTDGPKPNESKSFPGLTVIAVVILKFGWRDKKRCAAASGSKIGIDSMAKTPLVNLAENSYEVACSFEVFVSPVIGNENDINITREIELLSPEFTQRKNGNSEFGESRKSGRFENMKISGIAPECTDIRIRRATKEKRKCAANPAFVSRNLQSGVSGLWCGEAEPV